MIGKCRNLLRYGFQNLRAEKDLKSESNLQKIEKTKRLCRQKYLSSAFTLAEVLITLVVIGIIAAITVPVILGEYQKQVTVERLKKAYSSLSQTTARAIADNGSIESWDMSSSESFAKAYLLPYLSVGSTNQESLRYGYKYLNGKNASDRLGDYIFSLNDGTIIGLRLATYYVITIIDTNGVKKPNIMGRDIFRYEYGISDPSAYYTGKFVPTGVELKRNVLQCTSNHCCTKNASAEYAGSRCATAIMIDGWQISKDYPW